MLFDLRSPRRRRVVQIVFGALAVVFAVSFIFLGIGTEGGGNPLADFLGTGGGGGDGQEEAIEDAQKALEENPNDPQALAELVQAHYQAGNASVEIDESGQTTLTSEAEQEYVKAADAWDRYVKATKGNVNSSVVLTAVQNFGALASGQLTNAAGGSGQAALDEAEDSLANWEAAAEAQRLVAEKQGDAEAYSRLAEYLFFAGEFEQGQQAAQRAIAAAEGAKEKELQQSLDAAESQSRQIVSAIERYRKQVEKASAGAPGGAPGENPLSEIGGGGLSGGGGALGAP